MLGRITFQAELDNANLQDFDAHWWDGMCIPDGEFMPIRPGLTYVMPPAEQARNAYTQKTLTSENESAILIISAFTSSEIHTARQRMDRLIEAYSNSSINFQGEAAGYMAKKIVFPAAIYYIWAELLMWHIDLPLARREDARVEFGTNHFALYASRYHADQLRIRVHETEPDGHGGRAVQQWLTNRYWGDAVQTHHEVNERDMREIANLTGNDKRRYEICQEAIKAKVAHGTSFEDFIAQHSSHEYPTSTRTLRRWFDEFKLSWK